MPLAGGISVHSDAKHNGNAARDAVGGVCGLDASGDALVSQSEPRTVGAIIFAGIGAALLEHIGETATHGVAEVADVATVSNEIDSDIAAVVATKNAPNGIAGLGADAKINSAQLSLPMLTETLFRTNPATGTGTNPANINDGSTMIPAYTTAVGQYFEVQLPYKMFINEYRQFVETGNAGDGSYKIQYWDGVAWLDITNPFPTVHLGWSAWAPLDNPIYTTALRIVAVTLDTHFGLNRSDLTEIEFRA